MTEPTPSPSPAQSGRRIVDRPWFVPVLLFGVLSAAYSSTVGFAAQRDSWPNFYLPVQILTRGSMSFAPGETPFMFHWQLSGMGQDAERIVELHELGLIAVEKPAYYLVPTRREGRYVNIYGPGAGLSAVPYFAFLSWLNPHWKENTRTLAYEAKGFATICAAGSAVLLYLTLLTWVKRRGAILIAAAYGLGTCVWFEASQNLWQQTPTLLYLSIGTYFLTRPNGGWRNAAAAGLAYGAAVLCRPPTLILLAAAGLFLARRDRRSAVAYGAAAAIPLGILAAYGLYYFGTPWAFGQEEAGRTFARGLTGKDDLWSTPLWEGLPGLLISPSRGLLVFSPFLAFAFWGALEAWRKPGYEGLKPLTIACLALLVVAGKWFIWWGGWSFGYRMIVELTPLLTLMIAPVADRLFERRAGMIAFLALAVASAGIQALGASGYWPGDWEARAVYEIPAPGGGTVRVDSADDRLARFEAAGGKVAPLRLDIDYPEDRGRLWSVTDSQISFLLSARHREEGRSSRRKALEAWGNERAVYRAPR